MELKYTKSGTPFIELSDGLDEYGNITFSNMTKVETGYKYICFSHTYEDVVVTSKGKGKAKRHDSFTTTVHDSYVFNFKFKRDKAGKKGVPNGMMPRRLVDWFINLFEPHMVGDVFPFSCIDKIVDEISTASISKIIETKQTIAAKKRKQKKLKKALQNELKNKPPEISDNGYDIKPGIVYKKRKADQPDEKEVNLTELF